LVDEIVPTDRRLVGNDDPLTREQINRIGRGALIAELIAITTREPEQARLTRGQQINGHGFSALVRFEQHMQGVSGHDWFAVGDAWNSGRESYLNK